MGKQTSSRTVNRARYEELLRAELDIHNDALGPNDRRILWFDAMLSRKRITSQMRWRVYRKLRELGFSLPAIGKVAGYHHTSILNGLYRLAGRPRNKRLRNMLPNTSIINSGNDSALNSIERRNLTVEHSI